MTARLVLAGLLMLATGCQKSARSGRATAPTGKVARAPLAALGDLGANLERGFAAILVRKSIREAFSPLVLAPGELAELDTTLRAAGVARLEPMALKYRLGFPGRAVVVDTFIHPGQPAGLLTFKVEHRELEGGIALSQLPAGAAALGDITRDIVTALRAGRCGDLPVMDAALVERMLMGSPDMAVATGAARGIEAARAELTIDCEALTAAVVDDPKVEVGYLELLARDTTGKLVGRLRTDLALQDGKLMVKIGHFVAFSDEGDWAP